MDTSRDKAYSQLFSDNELETLKHSNSLLRERIGYLNGFIQGLVQGIQFKSMIEDAEMSGQIIKLKTNDEGDLTLEKISDLSEIQQPV